MISAVSLNSDMLFSEEPAARLADLKTLTLRVVYSDLAHPARIVNPILDPAETPARRRLKANRRINVKAIEGHFELHQRLLVLVVHEMG